jgi:PKD repeat protein/predicted nucleotidyltransferase
LSKIFRNEILKHNTIPQQPQGLKVIQDITNTILTWKTVSGDETPSKALTYNVIAGTTPGGSEIKSPHSISSGLRMISEMGNAQQDTFYILKNLLPRTYYWSVQAIDNSFAGGPFGSTGSFIVDTIQASRLQAKLVKGNNSALTLSWKNGNGERRAVFCKLGSSGLAYPSNSTTYSADPIFGYGDQIGTTGWYCVYNGRDDSTTVVGLSKGASYSFQVIDYVGATGSELYYRLAGDGNPGIFSCGLLSEQSDIVLTGVYNSSVTWGDYDNDGDLDILMSGYSGSSPVTKIYRNNGNNSFTEQTGVNLFGVQYGSLAYGDYDNDGDLDVLLTGIASGSFPVSKIYRNNGNNTFTEQISISITGVSYSSAAWGDYNNDGWLDFLISGQGAGSTYVTKVYKNNGNSTFSEQAGINLSKIARGTASWGDYDNDGDLDILISGNSAYGTQNTLAKIYRNNGDNSFTEQAGLSISGVMNSSAAWGDYNNDGYLDILMSGYNFDGTVHYMSKVYKNNGDNTFEDQTSFNLTGVAFGSALWGDLDNDGDLDILITGLLSGGSAISKIYRNDNYTSFTEVTDITLTGLGNSAAALGDYDNDGDLDLILTGQGAGNTPITKIYRNNALMKAGDYKANSKPAAPRNLRVTAQPEGMKLGWSVVKKDETPPASITYNIMVKAKTGSSMAVPAQSDTVNGFRRIVGMGNTQLDSTWLLKNLVPGIYSWKVQAVDQGYKGGDWSGWGTFEAKNIRAFFSADTACARSVTHFTNESTSIGEPIQSYTWDFGDGTTSIEKDPVHSYDTSGTFKVMLAVASSSNSDTLYKEVLVYGTPDAGFTATTVCQGDETSIVNTTVTTGMNITSWSWDFGDGKGSVQQNPGSHGYLSAGEYNLTLIATTDKGCSDTLTKKVEVGSYPVAVINAGSPLTFCKGDSVNLSVGYSNNYSYQWKLEGVGITGADSSVYTVKISGNYMVDVINLTGGCKTPSEPVTSSVLDSPSQPSILAPDYVEGKCPDENGIKIFIDQPVAGYNYQWYRNGSPISNSTSTSIEGFLDQGIYMVEASLTSCKIESNKIELKYDNPLAAPLLTPIGPVVWYIVCSNNDNDIKYKWYYNGSLIPGAGKYIYVAGQNLGKYYVVISNSEGCYTRSNEVTIPVGTTGIDDTDPFAGLVFYPNPTDGLVTFAMENELFGDLGVTVVSQSGKEIMKLRMDKTTTYFTGEIDLTQHPGGTYFVKLVLGKYTSNNKIIVN